jgi:hypothetical protein
MNQRSNPENITLFRATKIIWFVFGLLEILLAFRFFLKLLAANPGAGFTRFIYECSQPFVSPFMNVFRINRFEGSVFEWTTLLAMAVYWILMWILKKWVLIGRPVSPREASHELRSEDKPH